MLRDATPPVGEENASVQQLQQQVSLHTQQLAALATQVQGLSDQLAAFDAQQKHDQMACAGAADQTFGDSTVQTTSQQQAQKQQPDLVRTADAAATSSSLAKPEPFADAAAAATAAGALGTAARAAKILSETAGNYDSAAQRCPSWEALLALYQAAGGGEVLGSWGLTADADP